MAIQVQGNFGGRPSGGSVIGCLAIAAIFVFISFFLLKYIFKALWIVAPLLLIAALIINWKVVAGAGRGFLRILQTNPLTGIIYGVLGVVAFPLLAFGLLLAAIAGKKFEKIQNDFMGQFGDFAQGAPGGAYREEPAKEDFADYEELDTTPLEDFKKAPKAEKLPKNDAKDGENPYDDLFK